MGLLFEFPAFFLVFVAAVLLFLIIAAASQNRGGYLSRTQQKLCNGCGQTHPNHAVFCRRCGRKLEPAQNV